MRLLTALLTTALLTTSTAAQALEVVTTIRPLKLIAEALLLEGDTVRPLLPGNASPHDFQLRPSDVRTLQGADLVIWVGPALESFLTKPLANLEHVRILQLLERDAEAPEEEEDGNHHTHQHHHHDDTGQDPHIWLDPIAAVRIAEVITAALAEQDPPRTEAYQARLVAFRDQVEQTDQALRRLLAPVLEQGYFVFHDGYRHFEQHYGLHHLGAFTLSPERPPGARHLHEIRQRLQQPGAICVFTEPQFRPAVVEAVTDGVPAKVGTLDPLGGTAVNYPTLLNNLGEAFADCLQNKP